jgi:hypothetical protein
MPEPNVLYTVTAVVVVGLVAWVAVTLKTAKEPWARPLPSAAVPAPEPEKVEAAEEPKAEASEKAAEAETAAPSEDDKA